MAPKVSAEYAGFRRQQILQAAWDSFADRGYRETTMRDIAGSLGLSTGVVYSYFRGKDEIMEALHEMSVEQNANLLESASDKESVGEGLGEIFAQILESCSEEEFRKSARSNISVWSEALKRESFREIFVTQHGHVMQGLSELAERGIAAGELRSDVSPRAVAGAAMALVFGVQVQAALIDDLYSREYFEELRDVLLTGLLCHEGNPTED